MGLDFEMGMLSDENIELKNEVKFLNSVIADKNTDIEAFKREIKYLNQIILDRAAEFKKKEGELKEELFIKTLNAKKVEEFSSIKELIKLEEKELNNSYRYGEVVDHPEYYNVGKIEAIDVIEDWKLNFSLGNVIAYIARCEHKEDKQKDLEKALWYLKREIEKCLEG